MKTIISKKLIFSYLALFFVFTVLLNDSQANDQYKKVLKEKGIYYSDKSFLSYAQRGDKEVVALFIKAGINIEARDSHGNTALRMASSSLFGSPVEVVKLLILAGSDVHVKTNYGGAGAKSVSSVYASMYKESIYIEIAKLLIDVGANVNDTDDKGITALMRAVKWNSLAMVKLLIESSANVNVKDIKGNSVLMLAVKNNNLKTVELLIDAGANVNDTNKSGLSVLMTAAQLSSPDIVKLLIKNKADVNFKAHNETILHNVIRRDAFSDTPLIIDMLVENGADIEARKYGGETPLMSACFEGNIGVAEHLIKKGARIDSRDDKGVTVLGYALRFIETAKLIVEHGADVNAKNNIGRTALMSATTSGKEEIVKLLLDNGADVNVVDRNGNTALEGHYYTISPEIQKLLVGKGALYAKKYIGIDIVEPVEEQHYKMGEKGKIVVKAKPGVELKGVSLGFEALSFNTLRNEYVGYFQIPANIQPGNLDIKVYAITKDGKGTEATLNIIAEFPPDVILTGIEMGDFGFDTIYLDKLPPGSAMANVEVHETENLYVHGIYSDGIKREKITSPNYGTTYSTSNEKVAIVTSDGLVKAIGIGKSVITARNGRFTVSKEVIVEPYR